MDMFRLGPVTTKINTYIHRYLVLVEIQAKAIDIGKSVYRASASPLFGLEKACRQILSKGCDES